MKRNIIAFVAFILCGSASVMAQSEFDAFKYSKIDINGTARYMGMAGAFGSLGGDASAIKDNPAGLGVYRKSEIALSLNLLVQKNSSNWNNTSITGDNLYKGAFNGLSVVLASPRSSDASSGFLSSNWSFAVNRLRNFNRSVNVESKATSASMVDYMVAFTNGKATEDAMKDASSPYNKLPWISVLAYNGYLINPTSNNATSKLWNPILEDGEQVTPSYYLTEKGYVNEYSLNWAGNFNNRLFLGAGLNFQSLDYTSISSYGETFSKLGNFNLRSIVTSQGSGVNLNVGAIACPFESFRIGLSFHTPTFYKIDDHYTAELSSSETNNLVSTPNDGNNSFRLQTPFQYNISAAYLFGKKGLISVEYMRLDYGSSSLMDEDGDRKIYDYENDMTKKSFKAVNTFKIGGEYKLTDNFAIRAGYATMNSAVDSKATREMYESTIRTDNEYFIHNGTDYLTAGFGYRESSWFIDFAYLNKTEKENFMPYYTSNLNSAYMPKQATVKTTTNNLVVTLGLRF